MEEEEEELEELEEEPLWGGMHNDAPAAANVFAGQFVQEVAPIAETVPAEQFVHEGGYPVGESVPAAQRESPSYSSHSTKFTWFAFVPVPDSWFTTNT